MKREEALLLCVFLLIAAPLRAAKVGLDVATVAQLAGKARVVVALSDGTAASADGLRAGSITAAQDRVLAAVPPGAIQVRARWTAIPGFAADVTIEGLSAIAKHPEVAAIDLDPPGSAGTNVSGPMIGADQVQTLGYTGAGVVVAVLDTGVRASHSDFAGSVIAEHCFCDKGTGVGCCPDGSTEQSGPGSAADDNGHGTNVAGIIASRGVAAPGGIAPGVQIVAVKVIDANGSFYGASQVLSGLDWILQNRSDVRVVNMSLGTNALFPGYCDSTYSWTQLFSNAIASFRARGTSVFVCSMNQGNPANIACPACIQNAVAVGAVWKANVGSVTVLGCTDTTTAADKVACFSNSSPALDLLGPGAPIISAGNGSDSSLSVYYGTSQATPHAAAGAALLLSRNPALTPAEIETALKSTGKSVTDPRTGTSFPRLQLLPAIQSIGVPKYSFYTVSPCRVVDTRATSGFPSGYGPPSLPGAHAQRSFVIAGQCGIPADAKAASVNATVWAPTTRGDVRIFPAGMATPTVSTINWEAGIQALANAALVPIWAGGSLTVQVDGPGTVDLIIDVNGYFK